MVKVKVGSMEKEYTSKTTLYEIAKDFKNQYSNDIVLAECDGVLCELSKKVDEDCEVKFITTDTKIGNDLSLIHICRLKYCICSIATVCFRN